MAKRQFRRSISLAGRTYLRIENAIAEGRIAGSVSGYLEQLIDADLTAKGIPPIDAKVAKATLRARAATPPPTEPVEPDEIVSQHFSF